MPIRISDIFNGANTADLVEKEWLPAMGFPSDTSSGLIHVAQATGVVSGDTYIPGDAVHYVDGGWLRFGSSGSSGAGFDPTLPQTITGEWSFDTTGGKSFIVSDDPTMASWDIMFGYSDHIMFDSSLTAGAYIEQASSGNRGASYVDVDDDGSVQIHHGTNNANGSTSDNTILAIDGSSTRSITVDELNINSEVKVDISGGKSFIVSDDPTLLASTTFLGIIDHHAEANPSSIMYSQSLDNTIGGNSYSNFTQVDDSGTIASFPSQLTNANGSTSDIIYLNADGSSDRTITVDELNINSEVNVDISGGKSFIVSDDPTMVSSTKVLGIFDHVDAVESSGIVSINQVSNTLGSSSASTQISAGDDGSVLSGLNIENDNGSVYEVMSVEPDGSSSKLVVVDDYTVNIDGSFYVVDDVITPTKYFGIFDSVDFPLTDDNFVVGHNSYVSGDNKFGDYWFYNKTDFSGGYSSIAKNANGVVIEVASVLADGTSEKTITADTITLTGATVLSQDPVIALGVATKQYVDYQTESALTSSGGVVAIDVSNSENLRRISLTENVTSWSFTNLPSSGKYRDIYIEITQDAVTSYTVTLPTGDKVAGGPWVMPPTLGASITVGIRITNTTTTWFPAGQDYTI